VTVTAEQGLKTPGLHEVDVPIFCALTRFGLRRPGSLLTSYLDYRRLLNRSDDSPAERLLRTAFLVENAHTWYSLSIWDGRPMFSAQVRDHVDIARRSLGRLNYEPERGPELWSTRWQLVGVSNNLNWDGFDLRALVSERDRTERDLSDRSYATR
jgi:hypothetical protein